MNTKGTKFLATLVVLAMVFAAFAVIAPTSDSDAASYGGVEYGAGSEITKEDGVTYDIMFPTTGNDMVYENGAVSGMTINDAVKNADLSYESFIGYGHAVFDFSGLEAAIGEDLKNATHVKIVQVNTALKSSSATDKYTDVSTWTKTKSYPVTTFYNDVIAFLIPQDATSVSFTITYYNADPLTTSTAKQVGEQVSFDISFADVLTQVDLSQTAQYETLDVGITGPGWDFDDATGVLTLDSFEGKAVFMGPVKQVTLKGDNVFSVEDYAVDHIIKSTENMIIKSVGGLGTLTISMTDKGASDDSRVSAIETTKSGEGEGTIEISATTVSIEIETDDSEADKTAIAIVAPEKFYIYESYLYISMDAAEQTVAIDADNISIRSCKMVDIVAAYGLMAINLDYLEEQSGNAVLKGSVDLAASNIEISAANMGIFTVDFSAVKETKLSVLSDSEVKADDLAYAVTIKSLINESESVLNISSLYVSGEATNNAKIDVTSNMVVGEDAKIINKAEFTVEKDMAIIGSVENQGTFNVNGAVTVSSFTDATDKAVTNLTTAEEIGTSKYVEELHFPTVSMLADGRAYVTAYIKLNDVDAFTDIIASGVATIDSTGAVTAVTLTFTTTDAEGKELEATVILSYDATAKKYDLSASGEISDGTGTYALVPSATAAETSAVKIVNDNAAATFKVTSGTFKSTGSFNVNVAQAEIVSGTGVFEGAITANANVAFADAGTMKGDVIVATASKEVKVGIKSTMEGNVIMEKAGVVTVDGTLKGNVDVKDVVITLKVKGTMKGDLIESGKYKSSSSVTEKDKEYKVTVAVDITGNGTDYSEITTVASDVGKEGNIAITKSLAAPKKNNSSSLDLKEGTLVTTGSVDLPKSFSITAEPGSTLTIKSGTVTANGAVIIVDGATFNNYDVAKNYGKIKNEIKFYVMPNTYYSSFEFAMSNAPEGTALLLSQDVNVTSDITVKDNVTITVAESKKVNFLEGASLQMGEGASFVLMDGSKITFVKSAANESFTGLFEYDSNAVEFKNVVLGDDNNAILAKKATAKKDSSVEVTANSVQAGTIIAVYGDITGSIAFKSVQVTGSSPAEYTSGDVEVRLLAELYATITEDEQKAASVLNNGKIFIESATTIAIPYTGLGDLVLSDGIALTLAKDVKQTLNVVNTVDDEIYFEKAVFDDAATITSVKATSSVPAYLLFAVAKTEDDAETTEVDESTNGELTSGEMMITGDIRFGNFVIAKAAIVTQALLSDLTLVKGTQTEAQGLLKIAGAFHYNLKTDKAPTYGVLINEVEYNDTIYTVYAKLSTAIAAGGITDFEINDDITLDSGTEVMNLGDVNLTVADGKTLYIKGVVTLGKAATTVSGSASISGRVVLTSTDNNSMLIVYAGATVDPAQIVYVVDKEDFAAKVSEVIISYNDQLYSTIYGMREAMIETAESSMNPSFEGYRFAGWGKIAGTGTYIGDTDILLKLDPKQYEITFTSVDGVAYYVDNIAVHQTGAPVTVYYGDVITANALPGYEGTPLVNGKAFITVDGKTTTVTASGVTPIPEPEPEKESEWTITTILLVILVILIAIMAVIVAMRLNRS